MTRSSAEVSRADSGRRATSTPALFEAPREHRTVVKCVRFKPSEWAEIVLAARGFGMLPSRVIRRATLRMIRKAAERECAGREPATRRYEG